jgi:nucleotide-binding universal stress UspA family protein
MNKKLMCPVDGSPASQKAAQFALQLAQLLDIPLSFVTVYHAHHLQPGAEILDATAIAADPVLAGAAQASAGIAGGQQLRFIRLYGNDIAATLVEFAETDQYDHIVMGSNGRRGVKRLLVGSVANEVVLRAHCPVTIVR